LTITRISSANLSLPNSILFEIWRDTASPDSGKTSSVSSSLISFEKVCTEANASISSGLSYALVERISNL